MAVLGLGSVRSCGVTTIAAGLAMLWPNPGRILVEADPAGGKLAAARGLPPEPGLVSLAAAARRHAEPSLVFEHCQSLPEGTPLLCGPPGAEQARSALGMLAGLLGRLGELDATVLLDCGRLGPSAPNLDLFEGADLQLLAVRPQLPDLHALAAFLEARNGRTAAPLAVLVGTGPYPPGEIAEALGLDILAHLPFDTEAAETIGTTAASSRRLTRTPLVRALRTLADTLARRMSSSAAPCPTSGALANLNGSGRAERTRR